MQAGGTHSRLTWDQWSAGLRRPPRRSTTGDTPRTLHELAAHSFVRWFDDTVAAGGGSVATDRGRAERTFLHTFDAAVEEAVVAPGARARCVECDGKTAPRWAVSLSEP